MLAVVGYVKPTNASEADPYFGEFEDTTVPPYFSVMTNTKIETRSSTKLLYLSSTSKSAKPNLAYLLDPVNYTTKHGFPPTSRFP
jgi:hypothetical protein